MNLLVDQSNLSCILMNPTNHTDSSPINYVEKSNQSVSVVRTTSLRDNSNTNHCINSSNIEDICQNNHNSNNGMNISVTNSSQNNYTVCNSSPLAKSKRCHSNEKLCSQLFSEMTNINNINTNQHQRGSSLRLAGKNATVLTNNPQHHNFQKIKVESSPRSNDSCSLEPYESFNSSLLNSKLNSSIISGSNNSINTTIGSLTSTITNNCTSNSNITAINNNCNPTNSISNNSSSNSSKQLKLKHRISSGTSSGGPIVPNYTHLKDNDNINNNTTVNSRLYTPRPPLAKRYSSDLEDASSDIESTTTTLPQNGKKPQAPKPPISPTRGIIQSQCVRKQSTSGNIKSINNNKNTNIKSRHPDDELSNSSHEDDPIPSDCELIVTPPQQQPLTPGGLATSVSQRSALRKNSNSPKQSPQDSQNRNSPSPTKSVKWNPKTDVKNIPRSHSWCGKSRPIPGSSKGSKHTTSTAISGANNESYKDKRASSNKILQWNESYIAKGTELIREQMHLLEQVNKSSINYNNYRRKLTDNLESQRKLVNHFLDLLLCDRSQHNNNNIATHQIVANLPNEINNNLENNNANNNN